MKYYSFSGKWPLYKKEDGQYFWLHTTGTWIPDDLSGALVKPKQLKGKDILKLTETYRYRSTNLFGEDDDKIISYLKKLAFYCDVLEE